ncbi:MAG: TonB-dependent receptor plug domain-containing protein [Deltaproteobacteria bacterium]|nr:TonB-dependent receptor plug domain-containing protein [Deltaproteobacteria bacterium]
MRVWLGVVGALILLGSSSALAQSEDEAELQLFQLSDLLKQQTTVASTRALTVRETPGIVTVISRDEILAAGAKDLLDVLMLVPGFTPAVDVEGVVDVGVRGIWGHEGKILLLIDGVEMNELLYSTNQLGLHYPADQMDSVEIIRGPGSVRYGGYAELAVINIKTVGAKQLQGVELTADVGTTGDTPGSRTMSVLAAGKIASLGGLQVSAGAFLGEGNRSDRDYVDPYGTTTNLAERSAIRPAYLNLGLEWKGLKVRYIHDGYNMDQVDSYGASQANATTMGFTGDYLDAQYAWHPIGKLTVTPELSVRRQTPWETIDDTSEDFYTKSIQRWEGSLVADYDVLDSLTVTAGVDAYFDHAWLNTLEAAGSQTLFNGTDASVSYHNVAALAEVEWSSFVGNLTAGLRFEDHSQFGTSVVPRVALTKAIGDFHFKLLASRAFRAPGIENISEGQNVTPEHTTALEAEAGYAIANTLFATVNGFNTIVSDPIVYAYDPTTDSEYYKNFSQTGSRGFEVQLKLVTRRLRGTLNYSLASMTPNQVDLYAVPGKASMVLGMPNQKLAFYGSVTIWRDLTFDPTLVFLSERYGYVGDGQGNMVITHFNPRLLANAFLGYKNIGGSGVDLHVGIENLFDQDIAYLQPYNGGHPPLPGSGREYTARATVHFE